MTTADLVERVALDCRIATEAPDVAATLMVRIRAALAKLGKRGIVSGEGRPALWSVGSPSAHRTIRTTYQEVIRRGSNPAWIVIAMIESTVSASLMLARQAGAELSS